VSPSTEGLPTSAFDYALPQHLIAHHPLKRRDESRLLVVRRERGTFEHLRFRDIGSLIPVGDALVLNETRVIPARLLGRKTTGARAEILLLQPVERRAHLLDSPVWKALVRPGSKLRPGAVVEIADDLRAEIVDAGADGTRVIRLVTPLSVQSAIERYGRVPLPPYIGREVEPEDRDSYQTVYARAEGSVAAPTAGLHFTPGLLDALQQSNVHIARLVLHVGLGTFRPVEVEDAARHPMHAEAFALAPETAALLNDVRAAGGALWAVGTTVTRTLETLAAEDGTIRAGDGWTSLFIRPPYNFRATDRLITNFHLPRTTLLMLVAAFAGYDLAMRAYEEAIRHEYRFYSFGDAMVIV
jgi:S-adenosylmethionine:tRNA ribosyltransferase-isomerase